MDKRLFTEKEEFKTKLALQIAEGRAIWDAFTQLQGSDAFPVLERGYRKWDNYNYKWLEHSFKDGAVNGYAYHYLIAGMDTLGGIASSILERTDSISFRYEFFGYIITPKIEYLEDLLDEVEFMQYVAPAPPAPSAMPAALPLAHLHPAVQQVAASRFASAHYSDAIQKACTALEKAVQVKAGLPATTTGASVMTTAFSKNNTLLHMADDPNEQFGFMALYQGAVLALRNHFAHNLTELTNPARALEWLSFFSALFYKLEEAQPPATSP